ncbi:MAG TPA: pilus assembly protein PilO, partial [Halomonas sp.]|nr:pilus assembly protein PilO [Halomonas sp.]
MIWGRERWRSEWRQLQDVDWQGLDVKEAGEWPALLKAPWGGLGFVIAVGGLSWWLVSD